MTIVRVNVHQLVASLIMMGDLTKEFDIKRVQSLLTHIMSLSTD